MGIKVRNEEIAWMEEFGFLDEPVSARGATVITVRSVIWLVIGVIFTYKGMVLGGTKIMKIVPVKGLLLIIPGIIFMFFGMAPSKSVRREVQFLFMMRLIIKKLMNKSKKSQKKKKEKTVKIKKNNTKKGKKKGKPVRMMKK